MRQRQQFLLHARRGDIELGRREETEEGGGGGGRGGRLVGRWERRSESVCKKQQEQNVVNHSWSYMAETKRRKHERRGRRMSLYLPSRETNYGWRISISPMHCTGIFQWLTETPNNPWNGSETLTVQWNKLFLTHSLSSISCFFFFFFSCVRVSVCVCSYKKSGVLFAIRCLVALNSILEFKLAILKDIVLIVM